MSKQARYRKKLSRMPIGRGILATLPKRAIPVKRSIDVSEPSSRHFKYACRLNPLLTKAQWKRERKPFKDPTLGPWVLSREEMQYVEDDLRLSRLIISGKNKEFEANLRIKVDPKITPLKGLYYVSKVATVQKI